MSTARMHSAARIVVATALLSPMVAGRLLGQCSQSERTALEAFDKSWGAADESGDRARAAAFLSDNFMNVGITRTWDKQVTLKLYEDILTDANAHGLMLVFHGAKALRTSSRAGASSG